MTGYYGTAKEKERERASEREKERETSLRDRERKHLDDIMNYIYCMTAHIIEQIQIQ
jgi:hypothetical protein